MYITLKKYIIGVLIHQITIINIIILITITNFIIIIVTFLVYSCYH